MHKVTNIVAATVATLSVGAVVTAAYGSSSNVFNNHPPSGWSAPKLSATCQRGEITIHFGRTAKSVRTGTIEGFSMVDPELKCTNKHEILIGKCAGKAPLAADVPPVTAKLDHGVGKPGDWSGIEALRASLVQTDAALNCIHRVTGVK